MTLNSANMYEGKIIAISGDKLTTTGKSGTHQIHTFSKDIKFSHDGKPSKVEDLKPGVEVRLTTETGNDTIAVSVETGKFASTPVSKA